MVRSTARSISYYGQPFELGELFFADDRQKELPYTTVYAVHYKVIMRGFVFILASTFTVGMVAGVYIEYMSGPVVESPQFFESAEETRSTSTDEFLIVADTYGGCVRAGCASYRLESDGSYIYLAPDRTGETQRYTDVLSDKRIAEVEEALLTTNLTRVVGSEFTGTCPVAVDGVAYRYTITVAGTQYEVDSCKHDLRRGELFLILEDFFTIFDLTHTG